MLAFRNSHIGGNPVRRAMQSREDLKTSRQFVTTLIVVIRENGDSDPETAQRLLERHTERVERRMPGLLTNSDLPVRKIDGTFTLHIDVEIELDESLAENKARVLFTLSNVRGSIVALPLNCYIVDWWPVFDSTRTVVDYGLLDVVYVNR